jgi:hypothetical protein
MLAWIGNLLIVIGLYKIGDKWRHAFLFSIAGEVLYIARSLAGRDYALAFICVVFCAMALRNWIKWGQDERRPLEPVNETGGVYELGVPAAIADKVRWVSETYTKHWYGQNGGQAVSVRVRATDGMVCDFILSNHDVARSFGEALIRHANEISRPVLLRHRDAGVTSGRQLQGPRPRTFDDMPSCTPDDRYMGR